MVVNSESGQSVLEFLIMLPVLVWLAVVLIRINTAIQISIVNQQYSRAQALFLTFNHAVYPSTDRRALGILPYSANQMMIGVSDTAIQGNSPPKATIQLVGRKKNNRF